MNDIPKNCAICDIELKTDVLMCYGNVRTRELKRACPECMQAFLARYIAAQQDGEHG